MSESIKIAVVGVGLIGGSLAYALRGFRDCEIIGYDPDDAALQGALRSGAIDRAASLDDAVRDADLILFCSGPDSILANMRHCVPLMKSGAVVTDICGVKNQILDFVAEHFPPHIDYIGLHPMAGKEVGGFANATPDLFRGAGFIVILPERYKESSLELLVELSKHVGAGRVAINRAKEHDQIIAYSSDLMHIAAAALCASYPPNITTAHTAGAFRDCTRVANIDAALWTELLSKNAEYILPHLEQYILDLTHFKDALESNDSGFIHDFLHNAAKNKRRIAQL